MCNSRSYSLSRFGTTRQIAVELMDAAYDCIACAKVKMQLKFRNDQVVTVYQGPPIGLSAGVLEESMLRIFWRHSLHPRLVDMLVDVDCITSYNVVQHVQKTVRARDGRLPFADLPLSSEAKELAAQIKCWFPNRVVHHSILLKHFLVGLLMVHLFEDFKYCMTMFHELSDDLHWLFTTSFCALKLERMIHCPSSAWLFIDLQLSMISDTHPAGHWHRLHCTVAGTPIRLNVTVKPEELPLSVLLRIKRPHLLVGANHRDRSVSCTTVDKRQCSFNLMLFAAAVRFCGKFQKARHRFWKRVHDECVPGSELYFGLMRKYKIKPARRWKYLLYLGWNDHVRAKKRKTRQLRLKYLTTGQRCCTVCW